MSRCVSRIGTPVLLIGTGLFAMVALADGLSPTPFSDGMVVVLIVQIVGVLTQIGITSWLRWSVEKIAECKATAAIETHNDRKDAHYEASAENHKQMREDIAQLKGDVSDLQLAHADFAAKLETYTGGAS